MDSNLTILILAFVAGFVLLKLYTTLGRRPERPDPQPAQGELPREVARAPLTPAAAGGSATGDGLIDIERADPQFESGKFIAGARGAYEFIIGAFAKGDRETLKPLLTPRVFEAYSTAIDQREASGGLGPELVRLKAAEIADASLQGSVARVIVKFEAELAEGAHGVRDAREQWTFERDIRSSDPNWRLARVSAA